MKEREKYIKTNKRLKVGIIVFSVLSIVMLIGNKSYALFQATVKTDRPVVTINTSSEFAPKGPVASGLAKYILDKAYTDTTELIAIDTAGNKCKDLESCEGKIREYRYIGPEVNNYIYLKDYNNSNETWRIIGLFLNDAGTEWNLKVVRDAVLPNSYLPATYTISKAKINGSEKQVTYTIRYSSSSTYVYWNKNDSGTERNRWEEAGLQYYLNTEHDDSSGQTKGYLSYLLDKTRNLLEDATYYLGTVKTSNAPWATPKEAYLQERKVTGCDGKGTASSWDAMQGTECLVYNGNEPTWYGTVGLMYPSDYGLSASENNWTTPMYGDSAKGFEDAEVNGTTWMYKTMSDPKSNYSWFLSPSSIGSFIASYWDTSGYVYSYGVYNFSRGVRPVLNLSSLATRIDGAGTSGSPYVILN